MTSNVRKGIKTAAWTFGMIFAAMILEAKRGCALTGYGGLIGQPTAVLIGASIGLSCIHRVSRLIHFSTRTGRHPSSACSRAAGDSPASTNARFSGFKNRSCTAWSNIRSSAV